MAESKQQSAKAVREAQAEDERSTPGSAPDEQRGKDLSGSSEKLEHAAGGVTTRDDSHDSGAPMLQGDPSEPQGPEDAFGEGSKRGDYRELVDNTRPHYEVKPDGEVVHQNPLVEDIGDEPGLKGGVDTAPDRG
jgi:hypothetical protein